MFLDAASLFENITIYILSRSSILSTLTERLARLPSDQQDHVTDALAILDQEGPAIARRMVANIFAEFRVPPGVWDDVVRALLALDLSTRDGAMADRVLNALRNAFTAALVKVPTSHGVPSVRPIGPVVHDLEPRPFGRLVALPALAHYWGGLLLPAPSSSSRRPRVPRRVVLDLIEELQTETGLRARIATRLFERLPLGNYVMWSTFSEDGRADPFPPRPSRFGALAAVLGLDRDLLYGSKGPPRAPCILLGYDIHGLIAPRVPTIVEAYAGGGRLNYYFEVFRYTVDVRNGNLPRTLPTPGAQHERGVPEVVHEVAFADRLMMPLELAPF